MININQNNLTDAKLVTGWNMSIFGNPKLTIICGSCDSQFKTRDYYKFNPRGSVACCPNCGKWNKMDVRIE